MGLTFGSHGWWQQAGLFHMPKLAARCTECRGQRGWGPHLTRSTQASARAAQGERELSGARGLRAAGRGDVVVEEARLRHAVAVLLPAAQDPEAPPRDHLQVEAPAQQQQQRQRQIPTLPAA